LQEVAFGLLEAGTAEVGPARAFDQADRHPIPLPHLLDATLDQGARAERPPDAVARDPRVAVRSDAVLRDDLEPGHASELANQRLGQAVREIRETSLGGEVLEVQDGDATRIEPARLDAAGPRASPYPRQHSPSRDRHQDRDAREHAAARQSNPARCRNRARGAACSYAYRCPGGGQR